MTRNNNFVLIILQYLGRVLTNYVLPSSITTLYYMYHVINVVDHSCTFFYID